MISCILLIFYATTVLSAFHSPKTLSREQNIKLIRKLNKVQARRRPVLFNAGVDEEKKTNPAAFRKLDFEMLETLRQKDCVDDKEDFFDIYSDKNIISELQKHIPEVYPRLLILYYLGKDHFISHPEHAVAEHLYNHLDRSVAGIVLEYLDYTAVAIHSSFDRFRGMLYLDLDRERILKLNFGVLSVASFTNSLNPFAVSIIDDDRINCECFSSR